MKRVIIVGVLVFLVVAASLPAVALAKHRAKPPVKPPPIAKPVKPPIAKKPPNKVCKNPGAIQYIPACRR